MGEAFLDSSVVIGLLFRHAGERESCEAAIPAGHRIVCSKYVIYEVARGFLRSLIALHNHSFEFESFADFHQAAYSGQMRFKPYAMATWLGAFTDFFEALDAKDGAVSESLKLEEFRAKLRGWIRRGWSRLNSRYDRFNGIGCRDSLPSPVVRADDRIEQNLPIEECGMTTACQVQKFVQTRIEEVGAVESGLLGLPKRQRDKETEARMEALFHLRSHKPGEDFEGGKCFRCGDALICIEANQNQTIVTKNRKHFKPIASFLGKNVAVAFTGKVPKAAKSTIP